MRDAAALNQYLSVHAAMRAAVCDPAAPTDDFPNDINELDPGERELEALEEADDPMRVFTKAERERLAWIERIVDGAKWKPSDSMPAVLMFGEGHTGIKAFMRSRAPVEEGARTALREDPQEQEDTRTAVVQRARGIPQERQPAPRQRSARRAREMVPTALHEPEASPDASGPDPYVPAEATGHVAATQSRPAQVDDRHSQRRANQARSSGLRRVGHALIALS